MTNVRIGSLLLGFVLAVQASAATILIQNEDSAGEGLNDPTDANLLTVQRGNNTGATLGAMRLELLEEAAKVWGDILQSSEVIAISASFDPLLCDESGALLGSAAATSSHADFRGAEPGIAYNVALAESLSGMNLNGESVEIIAAFNSDVDASDSCLGNGGFYYGLDADVPAGTIPLFPVVLHELAHGLGFSSLADVGPDGTGEFVGAGAYPDSYSRNLLDLDIGKSWDEMNDIERQFSARNEPSLVWKGETATQNRSLHLETAPGVTINFPENVMGEHPGVPGEEPLAVIPPEGVSGDVVDGNLYTDIQGSLTGGCTQFTFSAPFTGRIVLLDAADCGAFVQARWAQVEGAKGVIIAATTDSGFPDVSGSFISGGASIPYIGVEKSVGETLRSHPGSANVSIGFLTTIFLGDNAGRVTMSAPASFIEDVSVSHWSGSAKPDLLMHPFLGHLEYADVDLTAAAFKDIGWRVKIPGQACNVNMASSMTEYSEVTHEACEILVLGPDFIAADGSNITTNSGWEIDFLPGFLVQQGATLKANVCGQSLCMTSSDPMPYGCHTCVNQICDIDPSCCSIVFDQECLDKVSSDCGLVCE